MRRAHRPVPIVVPKSDTSTDFKLTDSGVFEQGGIVISKTGCIISKTASSSPAQTTSTTGSSSKETPGSCRPVSCSSNSANARAEADAAVSASAAAAAASATTLGSSKAVGACNIPSSKMAPKQSSCSDADSPSSSGRSASNQAAIVLEDLQEIAVIGRGSSGVVKKVLHKPSGGVYVLKLINFDMGCEQVRRQVTTEVKAMDGARHPHIVAYHQSYFANGAMTILMELMDGGSLWDVLQRHKRIPEAYLPELARQVLLGLSHLHEAVRICHRDIKPGNLLLSSDGQLKISDFGVSSQLSNSMSKCLSWVGTVTYMSPERIQGHSYSFNTDVWSLGLLLLECAVGRYPYPPEGEAGAGQQQRLGFWELLEYIVVEPAPRLPAGQFSAELVDFVSQCLQKDAAKRPSASDMLLHPFVVRGSKANLSDLLGPVPVKAGSRHAAMRSSAVGGTAAAGGSSRRPASAGSTAPGNRASSHCSSGGAAGIGRSSSVRGSHGNSTAAASASEVQHGVHLVGQLAPYANKYQLQRPASGSAVKVCTPPKQQQQPQPPQQRFSQLRQPLHPDLQQHLLSRLQVSQQPLLVQIQSPLAQHSAQITGKQQTLQQQQQKQQTAQQQSPPHPQGGQAGYAGLQQQQQQQHSQPQLQQHRAITQSSAMQQTPPKTQQTAPVSSGPLTALKPTPRKATVVPAVWPVIPDIGA